jgi:hypothetical protein
MPTRPSGELPQQPTATTMHKQPLRIARTALALAAAATLAACGGGSASTTGTPTSGLYAMSVAVDDQTLTAGESTTIAAKVTMRGTTPNSLRWFATPLGAAGASDPAPLFGDINCSSGAFTPPVVAGAAGEGNCITVLTIPANAKAGGWRVTATGRSADGASASGTFDITVAARPTGGFRALESSTPVSATVNQTVPLFIPFSADPGSTVSNVKYQWTAAAENPALIAIAGSRNSLASVTPIVPGQYRFDVKITADVNGVTQETTGSVVVSVQAAGFVDVIDAGMPQFAASGRVVSLSGAILNRDDKLVYATSWRQVDGVEGGPERVDLANANSNVASFVAPTSPGTYRFEYRVVKRQANGAEVVSTARTSVVVQAAAVPAFTVSAGAAQIASTGAPVTLASTVGNQGAGTGVTYAYQWTQTAGPVVALANANTSTASFIPSTAGNYTFRVTVTAVTATGSSTVFADTHVGVTSTSNPGNFAMTASAGSAQSVATNAVVSLAGSQNAQGTTAGVTYGYQWTQVSGAAVTLSNASAQNASFVATTPGSYVFRLTVTAQLADGTTRQATADTNIVVGGSTANTFSVSAGDAQTVARNTAALMTGGVTTQGSFAGVAFTYQWEQVGATPAVVSVSNANALNASFVPTVAGVYTFRLTVSANNGGTVTTRDATTQVLVTP